MKTVLLLLFASCSAFSQLPYSGEKSDLQLVVPKFHGSQLLPGSRYKLAETPKQIILPTTRKHYEYKMPVKKLPPENYDMPIRNIASFDKMNAAFYFKQKRASNQETEK